MHFLKISPYLKERNYLKKTIIISSSLPFVHLISVQIILTYALGNQRLTWTSENESQNT